MESFNCNVERIRFVHGVKPVVVKTAHTQRTDLNKILIRRRTETQKSQLVVNRYVNSNNLTFDTSAIKRHQKYKLNRR